jgi:hypothetical protein
VGAAVGSAPGSGGKAGADTPPARRPVGINDPVPDGHVRLRGVVPSPRPWLMIRRSCETANAVSRPLSAGTRSTRRRPVRFHGTARPPRDNDQRERGQGEDERAEPLVRCSIARHDGGGTPRRGIGYPGVHASGRVELPIGSPGASGDVRVTGGRRRSRPPPPRPVTTTPVGAAAGSARWAARSGPGARTPRGRS